jgi:import receptor subunit TOM20
MVSKTALGIAAGICGTIFVGYCVYFDNKRRSDPNFKQKLKERKYGCCPPRASPLIYILLKFNY